MDITILLPFIVLIGAMILMTRSAKNKQRQMTQMRNDMQPGSGVRTIGGMYATVKEVHEDTILLEVAPGVHAIYAKNSVGAVLDDAEYNRIVHGVDFDEADVSAPDDASSLTKADDTDDTDDTGDTGDTDDDERRIDLGKGDDRGEGPQDEAADEGETTDEAEDRRDGGSAAK